MSVNHFSQDLQETLWWRSQPQKPPSRHHHHQAWLNYPFPNASSPHSPSFNLNRGCAELDVDESSELDEHDMSRAGCNYGDYNNNAREREVGELETQPLFEKPLTPSDVGKLNRLVIPKQHAEKYFPLSGESGDKGLILSFEDESGKCWRFRYSYWSSSQSYVLTKGWSRYVKEKKLDAGDVILFERHRVDIDRLFIGWRRRGEEAGPQPQPKGWTGTTAATSPTTATAARGLYNSYPATHRGGHGPVTDCAHSGSGVHNQINVPTGNSNSKTLRLFGVDMECQLDECEPWTPDGSSSCISSLPGHHHSMYIPHHQQHQQQHYYSHHHGHQVDITFTQDVNHQQYQHSRD